MMFKNQMVRTIVELQKRRVGIHLTEDGYKEFLRLLHEEFKDVPNELVG